jgi:hypothetical protein
MLDVRIMALLYGPYDRLHCRLLDGFRKAVPREVPITLWLNQVQRPTRDRLGEEPGRYDMIDSHDNVKKYVAMRAMMTRADVKRPDWWVWFDDDSHIIANDWWPKMQEYIAQRKRENICYIGQAWFVHHLPGQWEFIQKGTWYRGRPADIVKGKPGIWFATGGYWWLRSDVQLQLDWPDVRLGHNGGDTLLGEAIRQNGLPFHKFDYGTKVNDYVKRRGYSEAPAGAAPNVRTG